MLEEIKSLPVALTCVPKIKNKKKTSTVGGFLSSSYIYGLEYNDKKLEIYTLTKFYD